MCDRNETRLVITPGEGTFHQFHGGVTTGTPPEERERHMQNHFAQYRELRGEPYRPPEKRAQLFGRVPPAAMRFLHASLEQTGLGRD